jgi:integrase
MFTVEYILLLEYRQMARAATRARHGSYIFQRGKVFWIKLQSPTGRIEKTLRTRDPLEAQILAIPLIGAHKAALLAARPRYETVWTHRLAPGRVHAGPDGGTILATDRELIHIGSDGAILLTEANGADGYKKLVGVGAHNPRSLAVAYTEAFGKPGRPKLAVKNSDDQLFDAYLEHGGKDRAGVHGFCRFEAESVWSTFKKLTEGKPLKACTRDDGRLLVKHFQDAGNKSATVHKKINWLNAAVNLAIKEGQLTFNPFSAVAPVLNDKLKRLHLDDADIALVKANLDQLTPEYQLLVRLLATTGMRLGEAISIKVEEPQENSVRSVWVGTKSESSLRRVPFPADVLAYLPAKITGPLFSVSAETASKRLNRFLRSTGIIDPAKCVHSLRHRAESRLRLAKCPKDWREALLGHLKTTSDKYGEYAVADLKEWIDKIGFAS